jgi:hypothetical protein
MGWQVNNGPERLATFYPAAQFRKSLYRPDVIQRLLESGSVEKALELADKEKKEPTERVQVAQVLPPEVSIVSPQGGVVKESSVTVRAVAKVTGKRAVTGLRLFVDDRPFEGLRGVRGKRGAGAGPQTEEWKVPLTPGEHKLVVIAESGVSKSLPAAVEVTYLPDAAPAPPKPARPNLYVLAIGIDKYPGEWRLQCCVNDARGLTQTFADTNKQSEVFAQVKTKPLLDEQATRDGILGGLGWLKENAKPHDVAVLYYGGHGETDDKGRFFLLAADWAPSKPKDKTTVTGDELKARLADLPCRVVLMLDACHSGAAAPGRKTRVPPKTDALASDLTGEAGAVVLFAAGNDELAGENSDLKHGYFTLALIEGLKGAADKSPKDGVVHLNELLTYVEYRGAELSKDEQHPTYDKPGNVRSFPLAKP